ncbi:MAG: replication-associated recombination protein A, partial [Clostridia bacterium]|nr:replication-associated recombination protein A [Clostridia bacterium]
MQNKATKTPEETLAEIYRNAQLALVSIADILPAVQRGFRLLGEEKNTAITVEDGVCEHIARSCGGDVRKSLNAVELCVMAGETTPDGGVSVTLDTAKQLAQRSAMRYDREGDDHYDIVSAYQKSMRGSDANAALHYLARLLEAGDLPSACRRLLVCANEDVGLAYPQIIPIVKAAVDTALQVGIPEARIPLANAVVLVCQAPKSNAVYNAINRAMADVQAGRSGSVPLQLQNKHYDGDEVEKKGQFYQYPHDFDGHWVKQQYLPDAIKDTVYYTPGDNKTEQAFAAYW